MNDLPEALESLSHRLDQLEKRVHALEHSGQTLSPVLAAPAKASAEHETSAERTSSVFAWVGRAMLGIAGAYVLRAVAASGTVPRQAIAAIGIAYAMAWLVWAWRAGTKARLKAAIYAAASALILAPMLWELTLRFKELPPAWTAGALGGFAVVATVFAWKDNQSPIVWVAQGTAAATALALSVGTRVMTPFLIALLLMVLLNEYAVTRQREMPVRWIVIAVADAAIWVLMFIYTGPETARVEYPSLGVPALIALPCLLFVIFASGVTTRAWLQRQPISLMEVAEAILAFLLAAWSVLAFAPPLGMILLGMVCLALSAACYALAFVGLRKDANPRNYCVFAMWGIALLAAGTFWCLPANGMAACLAVTALAATALAARLNRTMLELHAAIYLIAAGVASRFFQYTLLTLAGTRLASGSWAIYLVSTGALLCFFVDKATGREEWRQQLLRFIPALIASAAAAALMVHALLRLAAMGLAPGVIHVALSRTLTVSVLALALSYSGSRWRRPELTSIAYVALAFLAAKLLFEDLRNERMEFIAASIFLFAMTLIAVPRLARPVSDRRSHPGTPAPS
ncbi:MAG TPA: hypothetical protein VLZ50_15310 [Terracidiphilus sp.]|nr:hypothetical protein [Terracidiphilus sp.]